MQSLTIILNSARKRGWITTLIYIYYEYMFDFSHKVNTRGTYELKGMNIRGNHNKSCQYQGANYLFLKNFFEKYKVFISNKIIIDFGSGKGRILIMGMKYKAKKVIGIEFSEELVDACLRNTNKYGTQKHINTVCQVIWEDASDYNFSGEESVLFLYNPFDEEIMSRVLGKIKRLSNEILVVYINPVHKHLFKPVFFEQIDDFGNGELIVYRNKVEKR